MLGNCLWKTYMRELQSTDSFQNAHFLEILEIPQSVESNGESDHFLGILENLEILEILKIPEIPAAKRPFRNDPFLRSRANT